MNPKKLFVNVLILMFFVFPLFVFGQGAQSGGSNGPSPTSGGGPSSSQPKVPNPLASNNVNNINDFIALVLNKLVLPIGGMIAVGYIMYAGFLLVTAQGNSKQIEEGKNAFFNACIGTAILLGAWVIAEVVKNTVCSLSSTIC